MLVELVVVVGIIALLATVTIQNILRSRTTANEATAIGNLRELRSSLEMYRAQNNSFPADWQTDMYTDADPDFGPAMFNVPMTGQTVQGYNYTYTPLPAGCTPPSCTDYNFTAVPLNPGTTGTRAFFVNATGTVRHCTGSGPADASDATIDQPPNPC